MKIPEFKLNLLNKYRNAPIYTKIITKIVVVKQK